MTAIPDSDLFTCRHAFEPVLDLLDQPSVPASAPPSILHPAGPLTNYLPLICANGKNMGSADDAQIQGCYLRHVLDGRLVRDTFFT